MKIVFFIVALANVGLFMWEYKTGAFERIIKTEQGADLNQEKIYLVSELHGLSGSRSAKNASSVSGTDAAKQVATLSSVLNRQYTMDSIIPGRLMFSEVLPEPGLTDQVTENALPEQSQAESAMAALPQSERGKIQEPITNTADEAVSETARTDVSQQPAKLDGVEKIDSNKTEKPVICYEAGPFSSKSAYQSWVKRLNVDKAAIQPLSRDEEVISAYQVYYPAAETLAESEANVQMFKEKGITDLFLVRTSQEQGQISLGVFTKQSQALLMQSQMLAKGINTLIKPKSKTKLQYYALIADSGEVMTRLNTLEKNDLDMTVKKLNKCLDD